jgi:hypothetical protein
MRRRADHTRRTIGIGRHSIALAFDQGLEDQKELFRKHLTNSVVHQRLRCCAGFVSALFRACRETVSSTTPELLGRHIAVMGLSRRTKPSF